MGAIARGSESLKAIDLISKRWSGAAGTTRWIVAGVGLVVALNLLALLGDALFGGGARGGPASSSFTTGPSGVAAYAELLDRAGLRLTQSRSSLSARELDADTTVIALHPARMSRRERDLVARGVEQGSRLVTGGAGVRQWLNDILDEPPSWSTGGSPVSMPIAPVPEVDNVSEVVSSGRGSWADPGEAVPVLSGSGVDTAAITTLGRGRVILLADPSILHNDFLGRRDNAVFALSLVGDSEKVTFVEKGVGSRAREGIAALPLRWRWLGALLGVAALLSIWSRGRRLGPPEETSRLLGPPRHLYASALATTLARTKSMEDAVKPIKARVRYLLERRTGLPSDADPQALRDSMRRMGLEERYVLALVEPTNGRGDVMVLGTLLARLEKGDL